MHGVNPQWWQRWRCSSPKYNPAQDGLVNRDGYSEMPPIAVSGEVLARSGYRILSFSL
jgi:hypothetical protein